MDRTETTEPNTQDAALGDLSITNPDNDNAEAVSRAFSPQVVQDPYNDSRVFYEVPNLLDNRVIAETDITNTINSIRVLQQASGIKPIFLTSYKNLRENRREEIRFLENTCEQFFGSTDNLRRYQNAVLLGITKAPLQTRLHDMRSWLMRMDSPTMRIFANRTFLYDPLERGGEDFWSLERFREEISRLPCIPQAARNTAIAWHTRALLKKRYNEPTTELDIVDSVALVNHCAALGEQHASEANDKEAVAILGETGTGKSTSINSWIGCHMELRTPEELEEQGIRGGLGDVIVVRPDSAQPEATSIGHETISHTFMPQVVQDPNYSTRVYLDCPGFSDNRGPEINIANAINTRRVLQQARGVKTVFLTDYYGLLADRGSSIRAMERMCHQMFGSADNLRRHQNAVLLGVTKAPLYNRSGQPLSLNAIRSRITQANTPTAQILANRIFLFDPLDRGRGNPDFWSRERFLEELGQMPCIPQEVASNMFQTALTDSDKTALQRIVRQDTRWAT